MGSREGGKSIFREIQISKALSLLLRHAAEKEKIQIDSQGYANVSHVLSWHRLKSLHVTFEEILTAVETSDKKRFGLLYNPAPPRGETPQEAKAETEAAESEDPFSSTTQALQIAKSGKDTDASHFLIRATQGHSLTTVKAEQLLKRIVLPGDSGAAAPPSDAEAVTTNVPETVVHGTFHGAWQGILDAGGLKPMSRNHVHLATGPTLSSVMPEGREGKVVISGENGEGQPVISGIRRDSQILIYIDIQRALKDGVPFWISENGVVLSEGVETEVNGRTEKLVPLRYFDIVVERKKGLGVLMRDGKLLVETPQWMKEAQIPQGKNRGHGNGRGGRGKGRGRGRGRGSA